MGTAANCGFGICICFTCLLWLIFLGAGIASWTVPEKLREMIIDAAEDCLIQSPDRKDTDCYKNFQTNDRADATPLYQKFYFYHVTNVDEVMNADGEVPVPKLQRKGPYTYRKYNSFEDIQFSDGDNKMDWFEWNWRIFDESMSCAGCKETDEIITINRVFNTLFAKGKELDQFNSIEFPVNGFPGAASLVSQTTLLLHAMIPEQTQNVTDVLGALLADLDPNSMDYFLASQFKGAIELLSAYNMLPSITEEQIYFETQTAHDFAFGYNSSILEAIFDFENTLNATMNQTMGIKYNLEMMGVTSPYMQAYFNGTLEETREYWDYAREGVHTGKNNKVDLQAYYQYQNRTSSPWGTGGYWGKEDSSWSWDKLHQSTNLGINNPRLANNDNITVWVAEARRPVNLSFHSNVKLGEIELKRYRISDFEYLSSTVWPDNAKWDQNYRNGVLDLTYYNGGLYNFLTLPSFLKTEYEFYNEFYGIEKGTEEDIPYVDYEPEFGMAMEGNKRLQMNFIGYADPSCQLGQMNPLKFCFKKNNWAVSPNQDPMDPGYVATTLIPIPRTSISVKSWQAAVLIPFGVVEESSTATSDQIADWEKYVINLRKYLDDWEENGWVGLVVGLIFILCQIGAVCLCMRNSKMDNEVTFVGGDSTPTHWT